MGWRVRNLLAVGAPTQAQQSGLRGERRRSEMSSLWPQAEARDMKLATTRTGKRCPAVDLCPPQMKLRYEKQL